MSKQKSKSAPESVVAVEAEPKRGRARRQSTEAEPASPAEPTIDASVADEPQRASEPATETAHWNPTITMTWEGESEPCWTGAFDALAKMNALDAALDQEFLDEMRAALRDQGEFKGGGGAAPVYVLALVQPEPARSRAKKGKASAQAAPEPATAEIASEPTTEPEKPKRARGRKTKPTAALTLADLAEKFLAHIEAEGKSDATVGAYKSDLSIAMKVLGEDVAIDAITHADVARFNESEPVTISRSGQPKASPTIERSRRVLRLALDHAEAEGWITISPCGDLA